VGYKKITKNIVCTSYINNQEVQDWIKGQYIKIKDFWDMQQDDKLVIISAS